MKHLLILGAGGMGKTVYSIATQSHGYGVDFDIKGFLDTNTYAWDTSIYPPILGLEDNYDIKDNDVFICSVGNVTIRNNICQKMRKRGAEFINLFHSDARIHHGVRLGTGNIFAEFSIIGNDVVIGNDCLIQSFAVIGHDAHIGNCTRLDCHTMLVGGVKVGNNCIVHSSAVLNHHVNVEDNATIGACSFVVRKVKEGTTVFGNPAKKIEF